VNEKFLKPNQRPSRKLKNLLGWIIALILLIFYGLGLFVFHGTRAIHLLPLLALIVLIVDHLLAKRFRRP
jgi:hypothetical protein